MNKITIKPTMHVRFGEEISHHRFVRFFIKSDQPVDVYVFDERFRNLYYKGGASTRDAIMSSYSTFQGCTLASQELRLPFLGKWYLIISNKGTNAANVDYDVES